MTMYSRILLAIDLGEHSGDVAACAAYLARALNAHVDLLHVLDRPLGDYPSDVIGPESTDKLDLVKERTRDRMTELVEQFGLADFDLLIESGTPRDVILRVADERQCDLIVIGKRERHGLGLVLGSVTERVLAAARCDVIAVQVPAVARAGRRSSSVDQDRSASMQGTLKEILGEKGATIHSVAADATVEDAVAKMNHERIGAVLVMYGETLMGIFTERDVLTKVMGGKLDPSTARLADVMTKEVLVLHASATVEYAMRVVTRKRFRHLPVAEDGKLIGMVSSGDLARWMVRNQESTIDDLTRYISGELR
jgi:nucleotide-binding universal stress UspA family protein/CBS domain-containing protein